MPTVSIIVPVFNVEKYLPKCLHSILEQSFTDFELIIIDDESTDKSGQISDEYAAMDARIQVIHKKNDGIGAARNEGIKAASGQYIGFVDSDDYIHRDMYQVLYDLLIQSGADISVCGIYNCYKDKTLPQYTPEETFVCDNTEAFRLLMEGKKIPGSVCNKLHKKELFDTIRFPENLIFEDAHILTDLMQAVKTVAVTTRPYYFYVHRQKSITTSCFSERSLDTITVYTRNLEVVKKLFPSLLEQGYFRYYWAYFVVLDKLLAVKGYRKIKAYPNLVSVLKKNAWKIYKNRFFEHSRRLAVLALWLNVSLYHFLMLLNERKNRRLFQ